MQLNNKKQTIQLKIRQNQTGIPPKKTYTDGQQAHEKMFNTANY